MINIFFLRAIKIFLCTIYATRALGSPSLSYAILYDKFDLDFAEWIIWRFFFVSFSVSSSLIRFFKIRLIFSLFAFS